MWVSSSSETNKAAGAWRQKISPTGSDWDNGPLLLPVYPVHSSAHIQQSAALGTLYIWHIPTIFTPVAMETATHVPKRCKQTVCFFQGRTTHPTSLSTSPQVSPVLLLPLHLPACKMVGYQLLKSKIPNLWHEYCIRLEKLFLLRDTQRHSPWPTEQVCRSYIFMFYYILIFFLLLEIIQQLHSLSPNDVTGSTHIVDILEMF